jgi:hypothetical protein
MWKGLVLDVSLIIIVSAVNGRATGVRRRLTDTQLHSNGDTPAAWHHQKPLTPTPVIRD